MLSMKDLVRLKFLLLIMTGLDPVIFSTAQKEDARVKRGHDEKKEDGFDNPYPNFLCRRSCMGW
jgi:hypothetical protein